MDKARYLIEAHVLEGRSVSELAAALGDGMNGPTRTWRWRPDRGRQRMVRQSQRLISPWG